MSIMPAPSTKSESDDFSMNPIPTALRYKLFLDPWMNACKYRDQTTGETCNRSPVEWNHAIIYAGKQLNTWYAIIPLCTEHHRGYMLGSISNSVKLWCELLAILRGQYELDKDCPKWNWRQRLQALRTKLKFVHADSLFSHHKKHAPK